MDVDEHKSRHVQDGLPVGNSEEGVQCDSSPPQLTDDHGGSEDSGHDQVDHRGRGAFVPFTDVLRGGHDVLEFTNDVQRDADGAKHQWIEDRGNSQKGKDADPGAAGRRADAEHGEGTEHSGHEGQSQDNRSNFSISDVKVDGRFLSEIGGHDAD